MVVCAWASQSETKGKNGKKGDQTGSEVKIGSYYNFGQYVFIRFKNKARGQKAAKAAASMARNDNIGYGQTDRTTLFEQCSRIDWDASRICEIGLCNCDCSELVACAINFAYGKPIIPSYCTTGSIETLTSINRKKNFKKLKSYPLTKACPGDIIVKPYGHTIMVVENK